jgi:hypothetical protein
MKNINHYRPAVFSDCSKVAPYMRSQDVVEIKHSNGLKPIEALEGAFRASEVCNSIIHEDGTVVGMFGVANNHFFGSPWLLGTDRILEVRKEFIPQAKDWVEEMNSVYPLLLNYVHVDNSVSERWLKSLGFKFIKLEKEYGIGKQPFWQFVRIKEDV